MWLLRIAKNLHGLHELRVQMAYSLIRAATKLLADTFNCHGDPSRCFSIGDKPLALCARCTGLLLGSVAAIPAILAGVVVDAVPALMALVILLVDWMAPRLTGHNSSNLRRFLVGCAVGSILQIWWFNLASRVLW